ncbi:hypothetical protein AY599_11755 [Leptolyngbya valderiana BDU 20041]|nr:hypothetical protein AY599_11755 [Leptolyngbya valderiana BDU 20041]
MVPGLGVALAIAAGATLAVMGARSLPGWMGQLPLSAMLLAVLAGLGLAPLAAHRPSWTPGLDLARGPILKIAVALIGLRLSLSDLGRLGLDALPLVLVAVAFGLLVTWLLARLSGAHWRLSALLAVGTAICGASAIAATAPGLRARREETCYAVACIALIGLTATIVYPPLLHAWQIDPESIGLILGAAIHDTAQVTAAASLYEQGWAGAGALDAATVTKLLRNSLMLIVIPGLIWIATRRSEAGDTRVPFPMFILGFIALCGLRTLGDLVLGADHEAWTALIRLAGHLSVFAFAMAMAALALTIRYSDLRLLGWRPAAAAVASAALVFLVVLQLV